MFPSGNFGHKMGRRNRTSSVAMLVEMPWQVSAIIGALAFVVLRWVVPAFFGGTPILAGLALASRNGAWMALVVFNLLALAAFARTLSTRQSKNHPIKSRFEAKFNLAGLAPVLRQNLDVGWGRSGQEFHPAKVVDKIKGITPLPIVHNAIVDSWSVDLLKTLEWKRFELLCAKFYEVVGFKSKTIRCGADGGIDIKLFKIDPSNPIAVVQCKAWNSGQVGVKEIRELLGVMTHEKVTRGIFITTSTYSRDAQVFGAANPIQLLDGADFLKKLQALPQETGRSLLKFAFEGDYRTPTCPSCGVKMLERAGTRGAFWGCHNFPRCKNTFPIKLK